ncbi:ribonuclease HII [Paenibacillus pectinilyticus]|uniref:Ribonuclease HII n=1 Tax=Paenibacillus pectinilyticus TaxID=512399 RepID=A0A1C1A0F3_9BACL|nr:ribonuclease HII [Paenibacillus pectinilyticus]OCT13835.1 ribonuclease HII [Paenibacillus pectinilyticus]
MLDHEKDIWQQGFTAIAGIDEVGRGCLFGDVVAAAVIFPKGHVLEGVNDSKKLSEKKRELLFDQIRDEAIAIGIGIVNVDLIESLNIKQASRLAMKQAVEQLSIVPDYLLVDAEKVDLDIPQSAIIHGDALSQSIAAASIIAKVTRDRMCSDWETQYPEYGLAVHKGYATKHHREMLLRYGPTPLHRKLFIRKIMAQLEEPESEVSSEQLVFDLI